MSRNNKVNRDRYTTGGRLRTDDWARERRKQTEPMFGATRGGKSTDKPMPPWMANEAATPPADDDADDDALDTAPDEATDDMTDDAAEEMGPGGSDRRDQGSRSERLKQDTDMGAQHGARSDEAKPRNTPKVAGASGTPTSGKAPKARGTAARAASPQRAQRPAARKTASRGTQKATPKKGTSAAAKEKKSTGAQRSAAKGSNKSQGASKAKRSSKRAAKAKKAKKSKRG